MKPEGSKKKAPCLPLALRMPTWLLVSCAQWNAACKQELARRNDLFKARVVRVSQLGARGKKLLADIANMYRIGGALVLGCLVLMCAGILDTLVNDRFTYTGLVPLSMGATFALLVVMDRSLEKLWEQLASFLGPNQ